MRRIIVSTMVSLDGVMQAPGGPHEDPTGGFEHGGWVAGHWDDAVMDSINETFARPFDLLLGRTTYDIFAAYWPYMQTDPQADGFEAENADIATKFNAATKYVATSSPDTLTWKNTEWLGPDVPGALRALKTGEGPDLLVQGSSQLIQTLLAHGLVDEFRLQVFPLLLGKGKRLFGDGVRPAGLRSTGGSVTGTGVVLASYAPAGEVKSGSFAADDPSAAELERRAGLRG